MIEVQYTPVVTRIIIHTVTPGLIVGSGGENIRNAVELLKIKFDLKNPQIDVQRIENPFLDPHIVAKNIAISVENNVNVKRLGDYYLSKIMHAGAIGCEIVLSGKISGQRARKERFSAGYIKKCGKPAEEDVMTGFAVANPKLGNIGVTVKIMLKHKEISKSMRIKEIEEKKPEIVEESEINEEKEKPKESE
jgi:small subunit ribosomal protein S3